jgi:hypothetical protein
LIRIIARSKYHVGACSRLSESFARSDFIGKRFDTVSAARTVKTSPAPLLTLVCRNFDQQQKTSEEEIIMPFDSILFSVTLIAVLACVATLLLADFHSRSM